MTPNPAPPPRPLGRLYILVGEASGDQHAAGVVRALRLTHPDVEVRGMGGDAMAAEGVGLVEHVRNTSIMGFAEVIGRLGFIRRLMERVKQDIHAFSPDLILLVDYPGFNLRMARWARSEGFPVHMYIAPQVWAWKRNRVHAMARDLERLYVILPFEAAHYAEVDLDVRYVGHPLADAASGPSVKEMEEQASAWRHRCGLPAEGALLALLPGSRTQEIQRLLPVLEAAALRLPDMVAVVAGAPGRTADDYDTHLPVLFGETQSLYRHARAGLITSGTATLEAALSGLPQVVAYRTSALTYRLAKWFSRVRFISLVNLVLDKEAVPERIQGQCTPAILAGTLNTVLSEEGLASLESDLSKLRKVLSGHNAADSVARGLVE